MSSDWSTLPLGELLELVIDHRGKTPNKMGFEDFHDNGYPVLSAKHVKTDRLVNLESMRFSNEEMYKKWMKVEIQAGDIVLTSEAPLGEVYLLDGSTKFLLGQRVFGLRPNKNKINPLYLASWLASPKGQALLYARASGSTVLGIKQSELLKIEVDVAPEIHQNLIGTHRFDIIKKININNAICHTLQSIAQALFKSWFVDFDPVKAKIAVFASGGSNADAELAAMSVIAAKDINQLEELRKNNPDAFAKIARTAALFPTAMQDSEHGEIPVGWEIKQLSDICEVINGRAYKNTEFKSSGTPIVRIQNLSNGGKTVYSDLELSPDKYIESEDFIYAWSATFGPYIWRGPKSIYHYHIWKMEVDESIVSRYFLYLSMFRKTEAMKNAGTGSIFTHLTKGLMESQKILIANNELNMAFSEILNSLFRQITALKTESDNLSILRDTLLSELLSGRLAKGE